MGYAQPASSPMGSSAYSPTWGTRGPSTGPVPQLDMKSASNAGGRVSSEVATIERIQGETVDPLTQDQLPSATIVRNDVAFGRRYLNPGVYPKGRSNGLKGGIGVNGDQNIGRRSQNLRPMSTVPNSGNSTGNRPPREGSTVADDPGKPIRLSLVVQRRIGPREDVGIVRGRGMLWAIVPKLKEFTSPPPSYLWKGEGVLRQSGATDIAIQILRNANLAAVAAKIDEECNEDANLIAAKNCRRRRYTTAHLLAPVESMPNQDSPVRVRSRQTVYTYMPMRHMHQLLVRSEESEAMLCVQKIRHRMLLAESDSLMLSEEISRLNLERALEFCCRLVMDNWGTSYMVQCEPESAGEFPLEQFDQKGQLHVSDGCFLEQKHSLPRNNEVPEVLNPGNTAMRSPQLRSGISFTVYVLVQNLTPTPRVNLQMKLVTPVSMQRYQFGKVRMDGAQHSSRISGQDLAAWLVPNPVHIPPRLSNPSVIPYQGSVSMQSQAVGVENQRVPN
ncbi:hypothetical protein F5051DRAFT_445206 [Lentinula edodes]|nr:hypothetical protein F5051DRAFT_445206 [Lentinula edodes]